jgi:hypothetical protein
VRRSKSKNNSVELSPQFYTVNFKLPDADHTVNLFNLLKINNPQNPAEIVDKMAKVPSFFFWMGSIKIDLKEALEEAELEFKMWLEKMKGKFPKESSEVARERKVMNKYPKTYRQKKAEIRIINKMVSAATYAKDAFDKQISLLQSIGKHLKAEEDVPNNYDIENTKMVKEGALGADSRTTKKKRKRS